MMPIETARLRIRRMTADDAPFMLALLNDPAWLRCIGDRGVRTVAQAREYIANGPLEMYARLGFGFYIVEDKEQCAPMGICGLVQRDYLEHVDIGYAFLPAFCGQGYAFEAAQAVLAYGHQVLGLKRILATTRPENHGSARLLEKLGLRLEGTVRLPESGRELKLYAIDRDSQ